MSVPNSVENVESRSWRVHVGALGMGLAATSLQIALVWLAMVPASWETAHANLVKWDSGWYQYIASAGYCSPPQLSPKDFGNVAFFPGYPIAVRWLHAVTGSSWPVSLVQASQLSTWVFWTYFFLLLRQGQLSARWRVLAVLLILSQPAAFFLVAGYSESLFLANMLGFFYWSSRRSLPAMVLAAMHGFVMCSTRIVGLPLVIFPLALAWFNGDLRDAGGRLRWGRLLQVLATSGAAAGGVFAFFGFCWWQFGQWDLYFKTEGVGWGVHANYLAFFGRYTYEPRLTFENGFFDPDSLSRTIVPATLAALLLLAWLERRSSRLGLDTAWRRRIPYYLCSLLLFYVTVAGRYEIKMCGMVRYILCVEVLLVLACFPLFSQLGWPRFTLRSRAGWALGLWILFCFYGQAIYINRFTHSGWVASATPVQTDGGWCDRAGLENLGAL